jgi:hypothetical protein
MIFSNYILAKQGDECPSLKEFPPPNQNLEVQYSFSNFSFKVIPIMLDVIFSSFN